MYRTLSVSVFLLLMLTACTQEQTDVSVAERQSASAKDMAALQGDTQTVPVWNEEAAIAAMPQTKDAWLKIISDEEYNVLWNAGTERPYTSPLLDEHRKGTYVSADCGQPLFRSEQKYDSGTGWPSFWAPISADAVVEDTDFLLGYGRTELRSKCGGHLGHVFPDGPPPTGLRYCMNGLALRFIPDEVQ